MSAPSKVAASVHVKDAARMTPAGRKRIAAWLRQHAAWLVKHGAEYAPRFRGQYHYEAR